MTVNKMLLVSAYSPFCAGGVVSWTGNFLQSNWAKGKHVIFLNLYSPRKAKKRKIASTLRDYKKTIEFKRLCKKEMPDVVHINFGGSKLGLIRDCMMANHSAKKGIKTFMECHCDANYFYDDWICIRELKKAYKNGVRFLVLNEQSSSFFQKKVNVKETAINRVTNFVSFSKLKCHINQKVINILFVGHVRKEKGIETIYAAAKQYTDIHFTLVGPDFKDVPHPNLNNVTFRGEVSKDEVLRYMSQADLLLLPSKTEGLPMVILEAMSLGLPVIASNVGDIPNVLSGTKAGIFDIGCEQRFFEVLARFVSSFDLRKEASDTELAKFSENYDAERVCEKLEEIYNR